MHVAARDELRAFTTKDGSEIREFHHTSAQSLAEASLAPGQSTRRHYHAASEEIYVVLEGEGELEIDGERRRVHPGDAALIPAGAGELKKGSTIPLSRTVAPYNVVEAFSDLSTTTDELDVDQVSKALDVLAKIAARTPKEFRGAIRGVSNLSANLAARDQQINTLLVNLKKVSAVLNATGPDLERLFKDATVLFDALTARRAAVHRLLVSTAEISRELRLLVRDVRSDLKPALTQLETVTDMLRQNQAALDEALRVVPGFAHALANSLGVGPWWDVLIDVGGG